MKVDNLLHIKPLVDDKVLKETVSRIGIANRKKRILYPSCYIWEKDGETYLVHFKQLFLLTREMAYNAICEDDLIRRNSIAYCLKNWGLIEVDEKVIEKHDKFVFVLPFEEKDQWVICHKFNLNLLK